MNGTTLEDSSQILDQITNELQTRFISSRSGLSFTGDLSRIEQKISDHDNQQLLKDISNKETKDALFLLPNDKSLGPGGYPAEFFQKYWHTIGTSVCNAVKAFFHSGKMLKQINHTFITLILKCDSPTTSNQF